MFLSIFVIPSLLFVSRGWVCCNELFDAIKDDDQVKVIKLVQSGEFNVNVCGENRLTPLIWALKNERGKIAEILVQNGADPNRPAEMADERPKTVRQWPLYAGIFRTQPIHAAIRHGLEDSVKFLLSHGVKAKRISPDGGDTLLHYAARHKNPRIVELFLMEGVNLDAKDRSGNTPLHNALEMRDCQADVIRVLLRWGANVNAVNNRNYTPLHVAAARTGVKKINSVIVDLLLAIPNVDLEARRDTGETALMTAAQYRNIRAFRSLLAGGANIWVKDTNEGTVLHCERTCGNEAILKSALSRGINLESRDRFGNTPLLIAAMIGDKRGIRRLLKAGANVNAVNCNGQTTLQYAFLYTDAALVEYVLLFGADVKVTLNKDHFESALETIKRSRGRRNKDTPIILNILVETGYVFTLGDFKQILTEFWSPCDNVMKNGATNFEDLFLKSVNSARIFQAPCRKLPFLVELYGNHGMFALYKILKMVYGKKEKIGKLEERKLAFFDEAVMKISQGTYLGTLPIHLAGDIFLCNHYYGWKLERTAWNLAVASWNLKLDVDKTKDTVMTFITKDLFPRENYYYYNKNKKKNVRAGTVKIENISRIN